MFRVISMSFAQLDGVASLDRFFRSNGSRGYEDHIYTVMMFVHDYGMRSDFWTVYLPENFPDVMQLLQSSLREIAQVSREQARR